MFVSWPAIQITAVSLVFVSWVFSACKFAHENERFVVLRMGRVNGVRGPGFTFILVLIEKVLRVDLRGSAVSLAERAYRTAEGRTVRYRGRVVWRVVDPVKSVIQLQDVRYAVGSWPTNGSRRKPPPGRTGISRRDEEGWSRASRGISVSNFHGRGSNFPCAGLTPSTRHKLLRFTWREDEWISRRFRLSCS